MSTKAYFQKFMDDVRNTRKNKEDFMFEVYLAGAKDENRPMALTLDTIDVDHVVFRPYLSKDVRSEHKGKFDHPHVVAWDKILFVVYHGELKK